MAISVHNDPKRVGYATLRLDEPQPKGLRLSIGFNDRTFLRADGRRVRRPFLFEALPIDGDDRAVQLGPSITGHIKEFEALKIADETGRELGALIWEGIRPPTGAGRGVLLGAIPALARKQAARIRPAIKEPTGTRAPQDGLEVSVDPVVPVTPSIASVQQIRLVLLVSTPICLLLVMQIFFAFGLIGWRVEPTSVQFSGAPSGPFAPTSTRLAFVPSWYVWPTSRWIALQPFKRTDIPPWLNVAPIDGAERTANLAVVSTATDASAVGTHSVRTQLRFPFATRDGPTVALTVLPASRAPPTTVARETQISTIDDAACDRIAGNPFDRDRPRERGAVAEISTLSASDIENGLRLCDARRDRTGPDRRFLVMRGRLLAERAVREAAAGAADDARRDMREAVENWQTGITAGSAYAMNLLGAYHKGTFNRSAFSFTPEDEVKASDFWERGARAGNAVAQRNFAAQLLTGRGVTADPARAVTLLRSAIAQGDPRAVGMLGVTLYTGSPASVPIDKTEGWTLARQVQCEDRTARDLIEREVRSGAKPASEQRAC